MTTSKQSLYEILKADTTLRDMLGNNKSIVAAGLATGQTKTPFITLQEGPVVRVGDNLLREEYYVRVYDKKENASIYLNKIGTRIHQLLDKAEFSPVRGRVVTCRFESSLGELEDQALSLNFIEYQYQVLSI